MFLRPAGLRRLPRGQLYTSPWRTVAPALRRGPTDLDYGESCRALGRHAATSIGARHAAILPHARVAFAVLLKGLNLRAGSEVLLTPVTLPDLVNVILDAGLIPRWVDLAPQTGQIDTADLAAKIRPRCKVLLLTHLCGLAPAMDEVMALVERHDLVLLEDVSQAMGATFGDKQLGTFGRAGFFSLTTLKPISSYLGGLVVTDDPALAKALNVAAEGLTPPKSHALVTRRFLRDVLLHAASHPTGYDLFGHEVMRLAEALSPRAVAQLQRGTLPGLPNGGLTARRRRLPAWMWTRYTDLQAKLALTSWRSFESDKSQRRALGARLLRGLTRHGQRAPGCPNLVMNSVPVWWRFPYWTSDAAAFRRGLRRHGIDSAVTNLPTNHREPAFATFALPAPEAVNFVDGMVFLPIHPNLTLADMDHIAEAVWALEDA